MCDVNLIPIVDISVLSTVYVTKTFIFDLLMVDYLYINSIFVYPLMTQVKKVIHYM